LFGSAALPVNLACGCAVNAEEPRNLFKK
jgi:hypothetical protein